MDPVTISDWIAVTNSVFSVFRGLGIKTATQHLSWDQANSVTRQWATAIRDLIQKTIPAGEYASISARAQDVFPNFIVNSGWWDANSRALYARDIVNNPDLFGTIWRSLMWIFLGSPGDRPDLAWRYSKDMLDSTLILLLKEQGEPELADILDQTLSQLVDGGSVDASKIQYSNKNAQQAAQQNLLDKGVTAIAGLFGGSSTTGTTGTAAVPAGSGSMIMGVLLVGAAVFLLPKAFK